MTYYSNPFRPGAGHQPPYLAGREHEKNEFLRLIQQDVILDNLVLTGLRGVGKTVLLDKLKPLAIDAKWLWVGTDLSESASLSEERIALRLLTDIAVVTANIEIDRREQFGMGFTTDAKTVSETLDYAVLKQWFDDTPGLTQDKLRHVLDAVWYYVKTTGIKGIIFAYDEAQNLSDQVKKEEYPLALLLDSFQSIQKRNIPMMLLLTGLPTLFPKLVESRTFAERMFSVLFLQKLDDEQSRLAILKPIEDQQSALSLHPDSVDTIVRLSGGYPYFIQFMCREVYDVFIQKIDRREKPVVPVDEIVRKLDVDFFAGRWTRTTGRQRTLLSTIAQLPHCDEEFSVQDIVEQSKETLTKPFSASHISQMLSTLADSGLIYKNRHGRYAFAVPLIAQFIQRQAVENWDD